MIKLINLTPHAVNVLSEDKSPHFTLPPSGTVARVSTTRKRVDVLYSEQAPEGIAVFGVRFGEVVGLPAEADDVFYVVSALVKTACPERSDLLSPGELVRNEAGQPIGCIGLDR